MAGFKDLKGQGDSPTLFMAFIYFDISFMVWTMLGPLSTEIAEALALNGYIIYSVIWSSATIYIFFKKGILTRSNPFLKTCSVAFASSTRPKAKALLSAPKIGQSW